MSTYFRLSKGDILSSLSLLLISLPMSAGIAVASRAPAEAGIITAIVGAILIGLTTSSPLVVFGPAAGLSVFVSGSVIAMGGFDSVSPAIVLSGVWIIMLSLIKAHRLVNFFPLSVMKGMAAGIGVILILKMVPHLLGYDEQAFLNENFFQDGRGTIQEIVHAFEHFHPGAIFLSVASVLFILILSWLSRKVKISLLTANAILVVSFGVVVNELMKVIYPEWSLGGEHLLNVTTKSFQFNFQADSLVNWKKTFQYSLIFTAVIMLEGLVTLDIFQKLDPKHSRIKFQKELFLVGCGNILLGFLGGLPLMPLLIRSKANLEFGGKNRMSIVLHGILLAIVFSLSEFINRVPMASVAVVLFFVGLHLIDFKLVKSYFSAGVKRALPYFVTLLVIASFDLLWGILSGLVIGVIFAIQNLIRRTMVLVNDDRNYLLKFYKDVSFFNKGELREMLEKIPEGKTVVIDGTGNILIDQEIEEYLIDFAEESKSNGIVVTFAKSRLAISRLFKEQANGKN